MVWFIWFWSDCKLWQITDQWSKTIVLASCDWSACTWSLSTWYKALGLRYTSAGSELKPHVAPEVFLVFYYSTPVHMQAAMALELLVLVFDIDSAVEVLTQLTPSVCCWFHHKTLRKRRTSTVGGSLFLSFGVPTLRPASQAGPMRNPREGTVVLRDTIRLTWWCV